MPKYINAEDCEKYFYEHLNDCAMAGAMNAINDMPSADVVEVKHGEWIDKGSLSCRCSNCGCKSTKESKFCPNCGADMRGETE